MPKQLTEEQRLERNRRQREYYKNNKERVKTIARREYQKNKERYKANAKYHYELKRLALDVYKLYKQCQHCGYDGHPGALEFHHPGEKRLTVAKIQDYKWQEVVDEIIDRCVVLCRNCHGIEHYARSTLD